MRELIFSPARLAASRLISKRTVLRTSNRLIMPPSRRKRGDSPTVSTGLSCSGASQSDRCRSSLWPIYSSWQATACSGNCSRRACNCRPLLLRPWVGRGQALAKRVLSQHAHLHRAVVGARPVYITEKFSKYARLGFIPAAHRRNRACRKTTARQPPRTPARLYRRKRIPARTFERSPPLTTCVGVVATSGNCSWRSNRLRKVTNSSAARLLVLVIHVHLRGRSHPARSLTKRKAPPMRPAAATAVAAADGSGGVTRREIGARVAVDPRDYPDSDRPDWRNSASRRWPTGNPAAAPTVEAVVGVEIRHLCRVDAQIAPADEIPAAQIVAVITNRVLPCDQV